MELNTEKLATRGLATLIAYAAIRSLVSAASKPFWFDELCTLGLARQSKVSAIWDALRDAVDVNPPPFYLVERVAGALVPDEHIAFRLPSILAFCCVVLCVFVFVRKRSGSACALLCAAVPLMSVLYNQYAVEARGYSLVTACVAIALVCYQRADSIWWTLLMAFSLAAAETLHYYAVLALVPFALVEAILFFETRRLRPSVWLALLCGVMPLTVFWPLLSRVKEYYGAHFWAQPTLLGVTNVYGWFFDVGTPFGIAIAAVASLGVLGAMVIPRSKEPSTGATAETPFHEYALALGLLVLPWVVFVAMKVIHGGLTNRYMLPALLGVPLAAGYILPRFDRKIATLFGIFLFFGLSAQEVRFWFHQHDHLAQVVSPANAVEELVTAAGYWDLPVVVSDGTDYFRLTHYSSPEWARRFVSVVDVPNAMVYTGSDSVDKNLLVLRSYFPLQVYEFQYFAAKHPDFLLYSSPAGGWDWWPARLLKDGYALRLLATHQNDRVYLVSPKGSMR